MNNIARLPDRAVLRLTGEDAESFLQNVVTSDISRLEQGTAAYAALLTPQGKVLFDFFVIRAGNGYMIDCSAAQRESLVQRLTMYKLRSKVTIEVLEDVSVYACWGGPVPEADVVYADPRDGGMGHRIIGKAEETSTEADYHAHRISQGIADTDRDIGSGDIFPHEGNLDQLGGISFTKGCFVGQEVVSRMEHRGTARSRFIIATSDTPLTPETDIKVGEVRIGEIKSVENKRALALLRLDRAAAAMEKGEAITADGHPLTLSIPNWAKFGFPGQQGT